MARTVRIYDTTLRDGCQAEDVALTTTDKLRIAEKLDAFGIRYIEGGWPGSNPRDEAFFSEAKKLKLRQARLTAFGSTCHFGKRPAQDRNLRMLLLAETPVVTIFGKSWDLHVRDDLRISKQNNLDIIHGSIAYLKRRVDEVVYDAEHFFDGFAANPEYALATVRAAAEAGADVVCLCDTNGGRLPNEIAAGVQAVRDAIDTRLGIHCHNDSELAVANSLIAVRCGVEQVQGTINGFGERCGNANLCSIIAVLQLKMGVRVVRATSLRRLRELSHFVYELANLEPQKHQAFVGVSAFAHKGGVHVAAIQRNRETYEHIDPVIVGNHQRVLVSDLSGRANILYKAGEYGVDVDSSDPAVRAVVNELKKLENEGFQFEGAEASFELLLARALGRWQRPFQLVQFRVVDEKGYMRLAFDNGDFQVRPQGGREDEPAAAWATVMLAGPGGKIEHTAAEGNGPVNALDKALRRALTRFFPVVEEVRLLDYKVRVLGGRGGSAASVRVLIESGDGKERWGTVGVSHNVIEASWQALVDSFEYCLYRRGTGRRRKRKAG